MHHTCAGGCSNRRKCQSTDKHVADRRLWQVWHITFPQSPGRSSESLLALRKEFQPLPGQRDMFEEVIFFYARELASVDVTSPAQIRDACRKNFNDKESKQECLRALAGGLPAKVIAPKILLLTHLTFHQDRVLMERWGATVKAIYLVRDPAEYLRAAFNSWRTDLDANSEQKTSVGNFYRSPELSHELLLADGLLKWKMGLNVQTGEWFFLIQIQDIPRL